MTIANSVGKRFPAVKEDIRIVQEILRSKLNKKGKPYYNSRIDGRFGPLTERAIAEFQFENKLKVTGEIKEGSPDVTILRRGLSLSQLYNIINPGGRSARPVNNKTINKILKNWVLPSSDINNLKNSIINFATPSGIQLTTFGIPYLSKSGKFIFRFHFYIEPASNQEYIESIFLGGFIASLRSNGFTVNKKDIFFLEVSTKKYKILENKSNSPSREIYDKFILQFYPNRPDAVRRALALHFLRLENSSNKKNDKNINSVVDIVSLQASFIDFYLNSGSNKSKIKLKSITNRNKKIFDALSLSSDIKEGIQRYDAQIDIGATKDEAFLFAILVYSLRETIKFLAETFIVFVIAAGVLFILGFTWPVALIGAGLFALGAGKQVGKFIVSKAAERYVDVLSNAGSNIFPIIESEIDRYLGSILEKYSVPQMVNFYKEMKYGLGLEKEHITMTDEGVHLVVTRKEAVYFFEANILNNINENTNIILTDVDKFLRKEKKEIYNIIVNNDLIPDVENEKDVDIIDYIVNYK